MRLKNQLLFTLITLSASVHAQQVDHNDTGFYVGSEVGSTSVKSEYSAYTYRFPRSEYKQYSSKTTASSFGIYGGYRFTPYLGLESTLLAVPLNRGVSGNSSSDAALASLTITPKVMVRTSKWLSVYGRAGIAISALCDADSNDCWSGALKTGGIGAQFDLTDNVKIRVGYDITKGTIEKDLPSNNSINDIAISLNRLAASVHYQF